MAYQFTDINMNTVEGSLLIIAIGKLMLIHTDKNPDEVLDILKDTYIKTSEEIQKLL